MLAKRAGAAELEDPVSVAPLADISLQPLDTAADPAGRIGERNLQSRARRPKRHLADDLEFVITDALERREVAVALRLRHLDRQKLRLVRRIDPFQAQP